MVCDIDYVNPRNNGSGPGCPEYCTDWPFVRIDNTTGVAIFKWSKLTTTVGGILWWFGLFYISVSTIIYVLRRRNSAYLQRRGSVLIYVTSVGLLPLLHGLEYREFSGRENYPCALFLLVQFATFPLFITPYGIRTYILYQRYRFKRLQVTYWKDKNGKASMECGKTFNFGKPKDSSKSRVTKEDLAKAQCRSTEWYGTKLLIAFSAFVLLVYLTLILPRPSKYGMGCLGCDNDFYEQFIIALLDVPVRCASLWALYKVKHEKDPLELISEIKYSLILNVFVLQPSFLLHVGDIGKLQTRGQWEWGHVIVVSLLAMFTWTIPLQVYKSWKKECKSRTNRQDAFERIYNFSLLASFVVDAEDEINHILSDEQAGMFLLHYLNTEFSTENYYFYCKASAWEQNYDESPEEERKDLAKLIGGEFIEFGSPLEVNVPYSVRQSTLHTLKETAIPKDCFTSALREIHAVLKDDSFPRFRRSEFYKTYRRTYFNNVGEDFVAVTSVRRCCC